MASGIFAKQGKSKEVLPWAYERCEEKLAHNIALKTPQKYKEAAGKIKILLS